MFALSEQPNNKPLDRSGMWVEEPESRSLLFKERCFRVRVRVDTDPNPKKKIDPAPGLGDFCNGAKLRTADL